MTTRSLSRSCAGAFVQRPLAPVAAAVATTLLLCSTAHAEAPGAPGAPTGQVSGDRVALSWAASSDDEAVRGYNVYRDGRYLTTVRGTSYRATLGSNDTTRFYITAFDAPSDGSERGYSSRSGTASFERAGTSGSSAPAPSTSPSTAPGTAPSTVPAVSGAPSALTGNRTSGSTISLTWRPASANDRGYNIYRNGRYLITLTNPRFQDSGLASGSAYTYYIVAFDQDKNFSKKSAPTTVGTAVGGSTAAPTPAPEPTPAPSPTPAETGPDRTPPSAPTELRVERRDGQNLLSWDAASDAGGLRGYNVYRNGRYAASTRTTGFFDDAAPADASYYVIAYDQARNFGPRSSTASAGDGATPTTTPPPVVPPRAGLLPPASPPVQDDPRAAPIASPAFDDPFGFRLEQAVDSPVAGAGPTQPKNLRVDLVSNDWAEFSWAPSAGSAAVVRYEITRSDGVMFPISESLPAGTQLSAGTYNEYAKYWNTTSFIDCNSTRFAFSPGSARDRDAPWNCVEVSPRPGDNFSYTVAAIDSDGRRSPESEPITIAYAEQINAPVPLYRDFYLPSDDTFATTTDLSNTGYFLDRFDLVFEDEFDGGRVNADNWQTSLVWGDATIINGEQQYFVDTQDNPDFGYDPFVFDGGASAGAADGQALTLTANPITDAQRARLPDSCDDIDPTGLDRCEFVSGALSTWNRFSFIYGYVEGRIKASPANGALSSFYLYHRYKGSGPKRHGPEIDILEYLGENPFGDEDAFQTYHFIDPNADIIRSSPTMNVERNPDDSSDIYGGEYHTYGVLWEPQLVIWYIDGVEVKRLRGPQVSRQPMNIVNYLVSGSEWAPTPGAGDFPMEMGVDYIRVYQRDAFKGTAFRGPQ